MKSDFIEKNGPEESEQKGPASSPLSQTDEISETENREYWISLGQLTAGIVHDFNNLLQIIIGYIELLQLESTLSKTAREDLQIVFCQAQRASQMVGQILLFSRRSAREEKILDLAPLVKEAVEILRRTLPESIEVFFELEPGEYLTCCAPVHLQQILTNLAFNAKDFMPRGGRLTFRLSSIKSSLKSGISALREGEWIQLTIEDTGYGIPADHLPHIFTPFFTAKKTSRGTGLGLTQVYNLVTRHRGFIQVESRENMGTAFHIFLPLANRRETSVEIDAEESPLQKYEKKILLVEDEPSVRTALYKILLRLGCTVLIAEEGKQALEVYRKKQEEISLVLTDLIMPKMGGLELIWELHEINPQAKIAVFTGYYLEKTFWDDMDQNVLEWLYKPVSIQQLNNLLKKLPQ